MDDYSSFNAKTSGKLVARCLLGELAQNWADQPSPTQFPHA